MYWIHAAAITLTILAGLKVLRVMSRSAMSRGFGSPGTACACPFDRSWLRPKGVPAEPMHGSRASLYFPSGDRAPFQRSGVSLSAPQSCGRSW